MVRGLVGPPVDSLRLAAAPRHTPAMKDGRARNIEVPIAASPRPPKRGGRARPRTSMRLSTQVGKRSWPGCGRLDPRGPSAVSDLLGTLEGRDPQLLLAFLVWPDECPDPRTVDEWVRRELTIRDRPPQPRTGRALPPCRGGARRRDGRGDALTSKTTRRLPEAPVRIHRAGGAFVHSTR